MRAPGGDERVDVRRYLAAIRRGRRLVIGLILVVTAVVVAASLALPKTYQANTSIVLQDVGSGLADADPTSTQRELATVQALLTAPGVLTDVARRLPDETKADLESKISSEVNPEANIITVTASDDTPAGAARIANAVTDTFLAQRANLERARIQRARAKLEDELGRLQAAPNQDQQVAALRDRISQLTVSEGSAGSDLTVVGRAEKPDGPSSPRPLRNGVLAIFGAFFLGVLLALGRDQLTPRLGGPRELTRLLDLRMLAGIPYVRGRSGRRSQMLSGVEAEAYETLRASVELGAPAETHPVILITGAVHGEGKTTATWRLGQALTRAGHSVLIVSADLRVPRMHDVAGVPLGVGLSDILAMIDWDGGDPDPEILQRALVSVIDAGPGKRRQGRLHLVTSGTKAKDPGRLVSGPAMAGFLRYVKQLNYDFVLVDAPPLLGIVDSQVLARHVDHVLLVNRLDRLTLDQVADLRQVLDGIERTPMGIVIIGARGEASPYYLQRRPPLVTEGSGAESRT
jgi:Mrp family chromosome partitioning ATPase/capsular polysaccharide biosynthesis protein